jgi:hypothetical protein
MDTRGKPFEPGNKISRGRPKGSKNKMNQEGRQFLQLHTKALVAKALRLAVDGSERVLCHLLTLAFGAKTMPANLGDMRMKTIDDLLTLFERIAKKLAAGEITPEQAEVMFGMIHKSRGLIESHEFEQRLREVEKARAKNGDEPEEQAA